MIKQHTFYSLKEMNQFIKNFELSREDILAVEHEIPSYDPNVVRHATYELFYWHNK